MRATASFAPFLDATPRDHDDLRGEGEVRIHGTVATRVADGPSPSLGGTRGAPRLMRIMFLLGAVFATADATAGTPNIVLDLVKSIPGFPVVYVGDRHDEPGHPTLLAHVLAAMLAAHPEMPVDFNRELVGGSAQGRAKIDRYDQYAAHRATAGRTAGLVVDELRRIGQHEPVAEAQALRDDLIRPEVTIHLQSLDDPGRRDIRAMLERQQAGGTATIASLGAAHFLGQPMRGTKLVRIPSMGGVTDAAQDYPGLPPEAFNDLWDVLDRSVRQGTPAVYMMTTNSFSPPQLENRFGHYYVRESGKNYAYLRFPIAEGLDVTVLVPASMLPRMDALARKYPQHILLVAPPSRPGSCAGTDGNGAWKPHST